MNNKNDSNKIYSVDSLLDDISFDKNKNNSYKEPPVNNSKKEHFVPKENIMTEEIYSNSISDYIEEEIVEEKEAPDNLFSKEDIDRVIKKNNLFITIFFISLIGMVSMYFIYIKWDSDNIDVASEIALLQQNTNIEEIPNTIEKTTINSIDNNPKQSNNAIYIDSDNNINNEYFNPYFDFVSVSYINVDINKLIRTNSDTIGWIQVNGTNINYPFVQTNNNKYYLNHSFYKTDNDAGWVFLDYRNDFDNLDQNNIIYAHGRNNDTMFGSLKKAINSSWFQDPDNKYIKISSKYSNTVWEVFSTYTIVPETYYLQTNFYSENDFMSFCETLLNRSVYDYNTIIESNDKILTLSSCYNDDLRVVLHAKLVSESKK